MTLAIKPHNETGTSSHDTDHIVCHEHAGRQKTGGQIPFSLERMDAALDQFAGQMRFLVSLFADRVIGQNPVLIVTIGRDPLVDEDRVLGIGQFGDRLESRIKGVYM